MSPWSWAASTVITGLGVVFGVMRVCPFVWAPEWRGVVIPVRRSGGVYRLIPWTLCARMNVNPAAR
ncbi:hypothetical protein GCM10022248_89130 [Nonomuraea soli]